MEVGNAGKIRKAYVRPVDRFTPARNAETGENISIFSLGKEAQQVDVQSTKSNA